MIIERRSPFTGQYNQLDIAVTEEQLERFYAPDRKELLQDIFPNLSNSEREFIKTGYTDSDWKCIFGSDED